MRIFSEWKSWYEAHAEPADPIEGTLLYFEPEHGFFYYKVFPGRHGQDEGGERKARLGYYQACKM